MRRTLASVLELAGGLLPAAALRHIEVQRMVAHDKQTMLSVDIPEIENAAEVTKKLESFEIHDGDRIRIYPIVPYNQDTIFIEGHVVRPGRYSFRAGMRVTDVISSYQDRLPEPAGQYAEIVRLNPPDFHPSVESFDWPLPLPILLRAPVPGDGHGSDLQPFELRKSTDGIYWGRRACSWTYQTSGPDPPCRRHSFGWRLTPEAETADAQVFRYLPDGKFKIFSVSLSQALGGDPVENIILQPRDRLLIHRDPDAVEPATVKCPGRSGQTRPLPARPGNACQRSDPPWAAGLKNSADTEMADLTEYLLQSKAAGTGAHHEVHISAALAGTPT